MSSRAGRAFGIPEDKVLLVGRPDELRTILNRGKKPFLSAKFKKAYAEANFNCTRVKIEALPDQGGLYMAPSCAQAEWGSTVTFKTTYYVKDAKAAEAHRKKLETELTQARPGESEVTRTKRNNAKVISEGATIQQSTSVEEQTLIAQIKKTNNLDSFGF